MTTPQHIAQTIGDAFYMGDKCKIKTPKNHVMRQVLKILKRDNITPSDILISDCVEWVDSDK